MAVGNAQAISFLSKYKSHVDSSFFASFMDAAETALKIDENWIEQRNKIYESRRDFALSEFNQVGIQAFPPLGALYIWAKIPPGYPASLDFCEQVLEHTKVSITPGTVYGEEGEGYFRVSITLETKRFKEGITRLTNFIQST